MVKQRLPEALNRMFDRVYVCRKCKHKIRADPQKIMQGKVKCRYCGSRDFRPKKKEVRRR